MFLASAAANMQLALTVLIVPGPAAGWGSCTCGVLVWNPAHNSRIKCGVSPVCTAHRCYDIRYSDAACLEQGRGMVESEFT